MLVLLLAAFLAIDFFFFCAKKKNDMKLFVSSRSSVRFLSLVCALNTFFFLTGYIFYFKQFKKKKSDKPLATDSSPSLSSFFSQKKMSNMYADIVSLANSPKADSKEGDDDSPNTPVSDSASSPTTTESKSPAAAAAAAAATEKKSSSASDPIFATASVANVSEKSAPKSAKRKKDKDKKKKKKKDKKDKKERKEKKERKKKKNKDTVIAAAPQKTPVKQSWKKKNNKNKK